MSDEKHLTGVERITEERRRQVEHHGWSAGHDDEHIRGELAIAAACYAAPAGIYMVTSTGTFQDPWPWAEEWDRRPGPDATAEERIRALAKAGALCAAEIDRLQRVAA